MPEEATNPFASALEGFVSEPPTDEAADTNTETNGTETNTDTNTGDDGANADDGMSFLDAIEKKFGDGAGGEEAKEKETAETEGKEAEASAADEKAAKQDAEIEEQVKNEMGVKAHERFKQLKDELKAARTELAEAKKGLDKGKVTDKVTGTEEITKLKTELDAAKQRLAIFDVESTPEYEEQVGKPLDLIYDLVEAVAKAHDIDVKELTAAMRETDEIKQTRLMEDLLNGSGVSDRERLRLYQAANDLPHIWARQQKLRENAHEALAEIERARKEAADQGSKQRLEKHAEALNDVWDRMEVRVLKDLPDVDVATIRDAAANVDILNLAPEAQAFSIYSAVLLPKMRDRIVALEKTSNELRAKLTRLTGAKPGAGSGNSAPASKTLPEDMSFLDAIEAGIAGGV